MSVMTPILTHLTSTISASSISGGYTLGSTIPDPMIKPENIESWELGLDAKFLRIG